MKLNEDVIAIMKRMREHNKTARAVSWGAGPQNWENKNLSNSSDNFSFLFQPAKPILTQTSGAKKAQVQITEQVSVHDIGKGKINR